MTWQLLGRPTGEIMMNVDKPVWIVHYPASYRQGEHWQAYKAVLPVPKGRAAWSVDNKRVGTERGFDSVGAAMIAGEEA